MEREAEAAAVAADCRLREVECAACRPANRVVHAAVADQANGCAATATTLACLRGPAVTTNRSTRYGDSAARRRRYSVALSRLRPRLAHRGCLRVRQRRVCRVCQLQSQYLLVQENNKDQDANLMSATRGGPGCLNRISASISGASAEVRLPCGSAAR